MISNKVGTQAFSKAVQNHDFGDQSNMHYTAATPEPAKTAGASGGNEAKGDKNVGDTLNAIANPGGKDPSKSQRKAHNTLDKDDFLKLMLTQMKNQDPMNPLQSHEMAAQLAQFTSLEQLFNVNKNLEGLTRAQDPVQKYEALNFLGKSIKADSRQIVRQMGDQGTELRFNLLGDASKIKLTISDENGEPVKVIEYGNLKKGANKLTWAGTDGKDRDVKPGKYMFNVEAEGNGKKIGVLTETKGTITGINYTPEGPMLMVGDQKVRLQDVQKIEDDGLKERQNAMENLVPGAQMLPTQPLQPGEEPPKAQATVGQPLALNQVVPQGLVNSAYPPKKAKSPSDTEQKTDAKLTGAVMPLEVASGTKGVSGTGGNGITAGGAFAHR